MCSGSEGGRQVGREREEATEKRHASSRVNRKVDLRSGGVAVIYHQHYVGLTMRPLCMTGNNRYIKVLDKLCSSSLYCSAKFSI